MWLAVFWALLQAQEITVPRDPSAAVRIACPVGRTTRIVLPEPLRQLKGSRGGSALGVTVARTKPQAVIVVRPTAHPAEAVLEFRGPSLNVRLALATAHSGVGSEVHIVEAEVPAGEAPMTAAPPPVLTSEASAVVEPTPAPPEPSPVAPSIALVPPSEADSSPPSPAPADLDMAGILRARLLAIGRAEGLPGQRPMVLVDALQGDKWVWFRFTLRGGGRERVSRVSGERGDITTYWQETAGSDLRLIVQVARSAVSERGRLTIELGSGPTYTFALGSRSLGRLLKELLR